MFPLVSGLEEDRDVSVNIDGDLLSSGSIAALDDDLNGCFGLRETVLFCDAPGLQTALTVP